MLGLLWLFHQGGELSEGTVGFMIPQIKNSVQVNKSIVLLGLFFRRSVSMCLLQNYNCYVPNNNDNEVKLFNETLFISQKNSTM